jgi:fructose-1,6-bisphosphatase I
VQTSLREYLHTWAGDDATCRAVAEVITALADGIRQLADLVGLGALAGQMEEVVGRNFDGDVQKVVDLRAHELFHAMLTGTQVAAMASEEADEPVLVNAGATLAVAIDPLDGSNNTDMNAAVGSIFAILPTIGPPLVRTFLQPGTAQLAAGFAVYGPQTTLVLTVGLGTDIFTLDRRRGEFILTAARVRLPEGTNEFAINSSNYRHWDLAVRTFVDDCIAGTEGPRGADFNMRWFACAVAEAYRILLRGGVYLYPADNRRGMRNGRLRLIYEANPIAFCVEQAGGAATNGVERVLEVVPASLHQRTPFVFGAQDKVERIKRYITGTFPLGERSPLFGTRGLFRA